MGKKIYQLPILDSETISMVQEGSVLVSSDCVSRIEYYVVDKITKSFIKFKQIGYEYTEGDYTRPIMNVQDSRVYSKKINDKRIIVNQWDKDCLHIYDGESEIYNSYREAQRER